MASKNTLSVLEGLRDMAKFNVFMSEERRYCGILNEEDLTQVQQRIIASGALTLEEIEKYFKKK